MPSGLFALELVRLDRAEPTERAETVEAMDSIEGLLPFCCSENVRGGSEGDGSLADERAGRGGRFGRGLPFVPLVTGGVAVLAGWLPTGLVELMPLLNTGGLFVDAERWSVGRFGSGGGGAFLFSGNTWWYEGGGEEGVSWWVVSLTLNAAILSLMERGATGCSLSAMATKTRS